MEFLKREKAPDPEGILNAMVIYGDGWLVEVILQLMNLVMRNETSLS